MSQLNRCKLIIVLLDFAFVCLISALLSLGLSECAFAYVDPSVMTYTIQALAGVAVALSTILGVVWRRARKKVYRVLNIDENKHKHVEPTIARIDANEKSDVDNAALNVDSFAHKVKQNQDIKYAPSKWYKRIIPAALVSAFATFTLLVAAPFEIVYANSNSLLFRLEDIWAPVVLSASIIALALFVFLILLRGKIFKIGCAIVFAFGLSCYVQSLFLNAALPAANGFMVNWDEYTTITAASALVWIAIFGVVIAFSAISSWKLSRLIPSLAAAMIFIQGVGVGSLFFGHIDASAAKSNNIPVSDEQIITSDGLFEVSAKKNVIVFVLDTVDTSHVKKLTKTDPDYFSELTDFTMFTDVSGSMTPTRYGAGYLYTQQIPKRDELFSKFWNERFDRSSFIQDIAAQNYSIDLYTDSLYSGKNNISDYVSNIHPQTKTLTYSSPGNVVLALWKCAMYRDMTWALKPPFWFYTEEINDSVEFNEDKNDISLPYRMNDSKYYSDLKINKLTAVQNDKNGAFKFIHLLGSHWPYVMNEKAEAVPHSDDNYNPQTLGCFKIVSDYLVMLKELNLYDSSTIIITSDHGYFDYGPDLTELNRATSPIMFVKPEKTNIHEQSNALQMCDTPITQGVFHPTVISAIGGDYKKYGTPALDSVRTDEPRYYYFTHHDGKTDIKIKEYEIKGDATNFQNWKLTGVEWDVNMSSWD